MMNCLTPNYYTIKLGKYKFQYTIKRKNRLPSNCDVPEDASMVLQNLSEVLIIAYPLILIVLFLIARFIAGRSIKPISSIIETSNIITKII
jgi:hypothetical protein